MSKPLKIVLVANFLPDRQESMQRFAQVLRDGFLERSFDVELWRPKPCFVKLVSEYRYGGFPKYLGYLDKFLLFRQALRRGIRQGQPNTVYHIVDHSNAVYAPDFGSAPLILTCHDLLQIRSSLNEFPENRLSRSGRTFQQWILRNLARLKVAVCVSQKTRDDLRRLTGLPEQAMPIIHNGLNYPYRPMAASAAEPLLRAALDRIVPPRKDTRSGTQGRPPFFLGIGGAQWYKNRPGLIAIFCELKKRLPNHSLIYVGPPLDLEQQGLLNDSGLSGAMLHLLSVSNEELRAAYSLAEGLLFPSWEEGFGWPIAEAQASGCPVFTSNRPPMTEVGGEGAAYFDPAAPPAMIADTIMEHLQEREGMRAKGLRHAPRWQREPMIDSYIELYGRVLERNVRPFTLST